MIFIDVTDEGETKSDVSWKLREIANLIDQGYVAGEGWSISGKEGAEEEYDPEDKEATDHDC